ncbi:DUF6114 domain-containing protein [Nocardioides limicola]|uniref:DUF6114 domain-containing protein n=1 Tax=Nocardioides limicola TaxID=2803368 RepID=UPI00193BF8D8|nr:DUF6114 domain-containing protein [Nocardioides sp. DJM-14]
MTAVLARSPRGLWSFARWRQRRPFWGGTWLILAGVLVARTSVLPVAVVVTGTPGRSLGVGFGGLLILLGLLAWVVPYYRHAWGGLGMFVAVCALLGSNLGALGLGTAFGILGGAMVLAWAPAGVADD